MVPNVRRPPAIRRLGLKPNLRDEAFCVSGAALARRRTGGTSNNENAVSTALSARSDGLDDGDGGPERRVYTQMGGIEQVRVGRLHQRGGGAL